MAVRPFIPWPDRRLRTPAALVGKPDDETAAILQDMLDTMYAMPGYGLAAPQIGVMKRLAVVDCSEARNRPMRLIDPEIIEASKDLFEWTEASPNRPGIAFKVKRPRKVIVAFTDKHGMRVRETFENLWSTSVQHQIDHLDGKMFFDRLSRVKRDMLLKKAAKKAGG